MLTAPGSIHLLTYSAARLHRAIAANNTTEILKIISINSRENFSNICKELIIRSNNTEIVKSLLDNYGHMINIYDKNEAFRFVAKNGRHQVVKLLLNHCGAKISAPNKNWVFGHALKNGHYQVVELLLTQCGADISAGYKIFTFGHAVKNGHHQLVKLLLNLYSVQINDELKEKALVFAIRNGHLAMLNALLADKSVLALAANDNNRVLMKARMRANGGPEDAARYQPIIDRLMDIPAVKQLAAQQQAPGFISSFSDSGTTLYNAIAVGDTTETSKIANSISRPNFSSIRKNNSESNVLKVCGNNTEIVKILLDNYNDEISADDKVLALHAAALNGHDQIVALLLKRCSKEISADDKGSALELAALNGHDQIVTLLLKRCSKEISADDKGSALELAALNGHNYIVSLLRNHCSTEISADNALGNAAENGYQQIVGLLLDQYSADGHWSADGHCSADGKGEALMLAARNGHLATLNALLADKSVLALAADSNNQALREAQMRVNGGLEDATRYQPIIDRLMRIPAVADLATQQQIAQSQHRQQDMALAENPPAPILFNKPKREEEDPRNDPDAANSIKKRKLD